jgi:hypothetical protein
MRKELLLRTAVIAACLLVVSGCEQRRSDETSGEANPKAWPGFASVPGPVLVGHPLKLSEMSGTERRWGMAPKCGAGIVDQDDGCSESRPMLIIDASCRVRSGRERSRSAWSRSDRGAKP